MSRIFPVQSVRELSLLLDVSEVELWRIAETASTSYSCWDEPKPSGGTRSLSSPFKLLKSVQKKLHKRLFKPLDFGEYSHYGIKRKSNITNALEHAGCKAVFTFDLKSFFPSVRPERVLKALVVELSCQKDVACLITKLVTSNYQLPQGAPTSTDIANIVTLRLQRRLVGLAKQWGLKFTIFADDVTFSGGPLPVDIVTRVKKIVQSEGFKIHPGKGGLFDKSSSQIVTGINIAHGFSVGKTKKTWRAELHKASQDYGLAIITEQAWIKAQQRFNSRMSYAAAVKKSALPITSVR